MFFLKRPNIGWGLKISRISIFTALAYRLPPYPVAGGKLDTHGANAS